ncbi:MAG: glycosyltransferase family 4 protein [Candidatus Riflebacteria bacterium]|nr:glycosyltransferase family 4 protein [Candidatus Riflebacteria bacterium]
MTETRILWLTENYPPRRGGMAQACDRIVTNLRKNNVYTDVAFFNASAGNFKVVSQMNGKLIAVPVSDSPAHNLNILYNYITDPENKLKYTHIAAFGGTAPILALPVYKSWLGTKAVTLLRGNDFDIGIFQPNKRQVLFDAFKVSDAVCVLSEEVKTKVSSMFPDLNIVHISNGIDLDDWVQDPYDLEEALNFRHNNGISDDTILVGIFGQLKEKKGIVFFLENLLRTGLQEKITFLMVGDVEEQVQTWITEHSTEETGLKILQFPFMDRFELLSKYPACDFIALPSHYDGMPNVLLEAGALGIPVIAARTGGIFEVLPKEQSSLTFHPGNADQCRQAFNKAAALSLSERKNIGKALKDYIKENFNIKKESEAYLRLFSDRI